MFSRSLTRLGFSHFNMAGVASEIMTRIFSGNLFTYFPGTVLVIVIVVLWILTSYRTECDRERIHLSSTYIIGFECIIRNMSQTQIPIQELKITLILIPRNSNLAVSLQ